MITNCKWWELGLSQNVTRMALSRAHTSAKAQQSPNETTFKFKWEISEEKYNLLFFNVKES